MRRRSLARIFFGFWFGAAILAAQSPGTPPPFTYLTPTAGTPQSASAFTGRQFQFKLEVTATDLGASIARTNVPVWFTGPSDFVILQSAPVSTDNAGRASVMAMATSKAGSYIVTATTSNGNIASFSLSNVNTAPAAGVCSVTNGLDDNSPGSLRYQVAACGKGGTVRIGYNVSPITLTQKADIQITQDLTIQAEEGSIIDAGSASRIFFINAPSAVVTLEALTLQNGVAHGGDATGGNLAGGGAAGMGGAVFLNQGTLIVAHSSFNNNRAVGGQGGSFSQQNGGGIIRCSDACWNQQSLPFSSTAAANTNTTSASLSVTGGTCSVQNISSCTLGVGAGGGMATSSIGSYRNTLLYTDVANGGGGSDLGGSGGTALDRSGGPGAGSALAGTAGFGGGAGPGGSPGFGGGFGTGSPFLQQTFGGHDDAHSGGGGAGLGGAIFVRSGQLLLIDAIFSNNTAQGGAHASTLATPASVGQGKGGALFISAGALAGYYSNVQTIFDGNSATSAGTGSACSAVLDDSTASDTADVCGTLHSVSFVPSGSGQSIAVNTNFAVLGLAVVTNTQTGFTGIPVTFYPNPVNGASITQGSTTVATNQNGLASLDATANSTPGSYTVTAYIADFTIFNYSLANLPSSCGGTCGDF